MRYGQCKKPISFMVLLIFMVTSFGLTGCTAEPQEEEKQISFAYTLTDQEVTDALASIAQLETYIDEGKNRKILSAFEEMDEKTDYIRISMFLQKLVTILIWTMIRHMQTMWKQRIFIWTCARNVYA